MIRALRTALQVVPAEDLRGAVSFRNVTFAYAAREDEPVLRGIDLDVPPGRTTALVGPSGSGKSTVAALLQRWYEPDSGTIMLDGSALKM
ncbi:ATP-binding cassette sub-family B member 8, mitochondrial [Symbiodinium microadriaticum]|uniref:ATP-binding cassette sub-family B member 8, mitochondrial n=1 Tax=Symbiodinium microadriaticum TaxID=2951 RepID=A0A1Q9CGA6_SYMMI|nr:ATP-binding cassette sub-family B member 8, mitochondrial [Symbiodinium microadriaticum]